MTILMAALLSAHLQLTIRVYDSAGVAPAELDRARASVDAILASVGIEPIWRPCHVSTCIGPVKPHEVVLRFVRSGPFSEAGSLGFSVIDISRASGSLGTIYLDRVRTLAAEADVDEGQLLGRAIAHEIGHMLLGRASHPRFGLMRAVWISSELRRELPSDWVFSSAEARELRQRLSTRMPAQVATILASMADQTRAAQ